MKANVISALIAVTLVSSTEAQSVEVTESTGPASTAVPDGHFLGPNWWGNRLQDWQVQQGTVVCDPSQAMRWPGYRMAHESTIDLSPTTGIKAETEVELLPGGQAPMESHAFAGLTFGVGHTLEDPLARLIVFEHTAPGMGYAAGITAENKLQIVFLDEAKVLAEADLPEHDGKLKLSLLGSPAKDGMAAIRLRATGKTQSADVTTEVPVSHFRGGMGLVLHPGNKPAKSAKHSPAKGRFSRPVFAAADGSPLVQNDRSRFIGPIVGCQYTYDNGTLKLSAQTMPVPDGTTASLQFKQGAGWKTLSTSPVDLPDCQARFRIEDHDATKAAPYRIKLSLWPELTYSGTVAAEPTGNKLRLGVLGCEKQLPWGKVKDWKRDAFFPHTELVDRLLAEKPDLLYFYGDQMYEHCPSGVDRTNIHLDYLYKWLFHLLAFRETTAHLPSIAIPDDHDVFQGNHWGEGAIPAKSQNDGGYIHPASFLQMVHRTHTSHLPDAYEPDCLAQNIPAYHTDITYGGVNFAIVADRVFKSGPKGKGLPPNSAAKPGQFLTDYVDLDLDPKLLDLPGLQLLGEPQERFLEHWAADWDEQTRIKACLSQSPLAGLATHHGSGAFMHMDLDANAWPQSGRKKALELLRKARAVHIAGDQHLSTLAQQGIDGHADAVWDFTAPAISNAYCRAYYPDLTTNYFKAKPPAPEQYLGPRKDGFGNKFTVHAVANPDTTENSPYKVDRPTMDQFVPGYGLVDFNTKTREITFHSIPRSAKVAAGMENGNYPGWPKTIKVSDNEGRKPVGTIGEISLETQGGEILRVFDKDGGLVYAERLPEKRDGTYPVHVYELGSYRIQIGDASPSAPIDVK